MFHIFNEFVFYHLFTAPFQSHTHTYTYTYTYTYIHLLTLFSPPTVLVHLVTLSSPHCARSPPRPLLCFLLPPLPSFIPPLSLYSTFVPLLAFQRFLFFSTAAFPHPFSPSGNVPNYLLLSNFNRSLCSSALIPQHGTLVDPRICPLLCQTCW